MKKILCFTCSIGFFTGLYGEPWVITANAQSTNTIPTNGAPIVSISATNVSDETSIFNQKLEFNTKIATLDRFGPPASIRWIRLYNRFGYDAINRVNLSGRDTVKRIVVSSSRESFASWTAPSAYQWANNLWIGSIGNTTEEGLKPGVVTPTASELSVWETIKSEGNISYGWRPYDSYAYAAARFGHWLDNPALILHTRLYYGPFRATRADFNAVVPMPFLDGEISGGISFNPADIMNNPNDRTVYIRYSRGLLLQTDQNSQPGFKGMVKSMSFFVGYSSSQQQNNIEGGFHSNLPWFW